MRAAAIALAAAAAAATNPLLCTHQTVTLTLDWRAMAASGKSESRVRSDMAEATAWVTAAGASDTSPTTTGAETCRAADAPDDAYTTLCRYCLPPGDYELWTSDSWGDGWGLGAFDLELEGCAALSGTQPKGARKCRPDGDSAPCNATTRGRRVDVRKSLPRTLGGPGVGGRRSRTPRPRRGYSDGFP